MIYNIGVQGNREELEKVYDVLVRLTEDEDVYIEEKNSIYPENGYLDILYTDESYSKISKVYTLIGGYAHSYTFNKIMTPSQFLEKYDKFEIIDSEIIDIVNALRDRMRENAFIITAIVENKDLFDKLTKYLSDNYDTQLERNILKYISGATDVFPYTKEVENQFILKGVDSEGDDYYFYLDDYDRPDSTMNMDDATVFKTIEEAEKYLTSVTTIEKLN